MFGERHTLTKEISAVVFFPVGLSKRRWTLEIQVTAFEKGRDRALAVLNAAQSEIEAPGSHVDGSLGTEGGWIKKGLGSWISKNQHWWVFLAVPIGIMVLIITLIAFLMPTSGSGKADNEEEPTTVVSTTTPTTTTTTTVVVLGDVKYRDAIEWAVAPGPNGGGVMRFPAVDGLLTINADDNARPENCLLWLERALGSFNTSEDIEINKSYIRDDYFEDVDDVDFRSRLTWAWDVGVVTGYVYEGADNVSKVWFYREGLPPSARIYLLPSHFQAWLVRGILGHCSASRIATASGIDVVRLEGDTGLIVGKTSLSSDKLKTLFLEMGLDHNIGTWKNDDRVCIGEASVLLRDVVTKFICPKSD